MQTSTFHTLKRVILVALALVIAISIIAYIWLWQKNSGISHPLPMQDQTLPISGELQDGSNANANNDIQTLTVVATPLFKEPLASALETFAARFPSIKADVTYMPATEIRSFVQSNPNVQLVLADEVTVNSVKDTEQETSPTTTASQGVQNHTVNKTEDLSHLTAFNVALKTSDTNTNVKTMSAEALDELTKLQGFVMTPYRDDTSVTSFRNFLLASSTQRYFNTGDTASIELYQNSVDDLFNPKGNPPADTPAEKLSIAEAIDSERERDNEAVELVK